MLGFTVFLLVVGALLYVVSLLFPKEPNLHFTKWAGLVFATLGVMVGSSALFVNHTPVFYVIALGTGLLLFVFGLRSESAHRGKLLYSGVALFVAGMFMVMLKPGWFLFLALAGVVALLYFKFGNDERVKRVVSSLRDKIS